LSGVELTVVVRASVAYALPQGSSAFTGCASQNVSHWNWQLWRIYPSTAPLRRTYSRVSPVFPTWYPDDGWKSAELQRSKQIGDAGWG